MRTQSLLTVLSVASMLACSSAPSVVERDARDRTSRGGGNGQSPEGGGGSSPGSDPAAPVPGAEKADGAFTFGTLVTDPAHAKDEAAGGVKNAMFELAWAEYEPASGQFDAAYVARMKQVYNAYIAAGMRVTLGLGLHMTPAWAFQLPNSRFINQNGKADPEQLNLVFNEKLRQRAAQYFDRIQQDFGLAAFWAIRLTSGGSAEVLYPGEGEYYAFDVNAKNGPDMPPTMAKNPFPQWKPGQRTITTAQVQQWADWYVGALANSVDWQIVKLDALGFKGYYQVLTPGQGARPLEYADDVKNYLPDGLTGVGAVWHKLYESLTHKKNVVAYVSSMADGSGNDDVCDAADKTVAFGDARILEWSATRWISRIADQFGLVKSGENPGWNAPPEQNAQYKDLSSKGMLAASFRQMKACGFQGMYWAHSERLWDGTMPFANYANAIKAANATP